MEEKTNARKALDTSKDVAALCTIAYTAFVAVKGLKMLAKEAWAALPSKDDKTEDEK